MLRIFRKTLLRSNVFTGYTDYHSHILPGVDDGIKTMSDALDVLSYYEQLGMHEVWLTPHIMEDIPNTTDALRQRFNELKETYKVLYVKFLKLRETRQQHVHELNSLQAEKSFLLLKIQDLEEKLTTCYQSRRAQQTRPDSGM